MASAEVGYSHLMTIRPYRSDTATGTHWTILALAVIGLASVAAVSPAQDGTIPSVPLAADDFESGLSRWTTESPEGIEILLEPGSTNHVLQLTPKRRGYVHTLLADSNGWHDVRFEGRFLFPIDGDGYLGFLYNHQETPERTDFGCLYVKSNGSYIRVSPHYDGHPSWRLYEDFRADLEGERRIRVGHWHRFRLDVRANAAELFIDDMSAPAARFDLFAATSGALGLEARPGGGEPVWVDDVRVTRLESPAGGTGSRRPDQRSNASSLSWQVQGPARLDDDPSLAEPELPEEAWRAIAPDPRGAVITALITQSRSGDLDVAYLRSRFEIAEDASGAPTWLAISAANRIDVWFNGYYRGTVAPERFIWSDYLSSAEHPGARIPLSPRVGENRIVLRVHGRNFAGGGFFADLVRPGG